MPPGAAEFHELISIYWRGNVSIGEGLDDVLKPVLAHVGVQMEWSFGPHTGWARVPKIFPTGPHCRCHDKPQPKEYKKLSKRQWGPWK